MKHDYMACPSSICEADPEKHLRIWYPDEELCRSFPVKHWQKVQRRIHKMFLKGKLRFPNTYFTLAMLQRIKNVTVATKGVKEGTPKERELMARMAL